MQVLNLSSCEFKFLKHFKYLNLLGRSLLYSDYSTVEVDCPNGYIRNPVSNTCIRLITTGKNWWTAKEYCERNGKTLATFETVESAFWFFNLVNTNSGK